MNQLNRFLVVGLSICIGFIFVMLSFGRDDVAKASSLYNSASKSLVESCIKTNRLGKKVPEAKVKQAYYLHGKELPKNKDGTIDMLSVSSDGFEGSSEFGWVDDSIKLWFMFDDILNSGCDGKFFPERLSLGGARANYKPNHDSEEKWIYPKEEADSNGQYGFSSDGNSSPKTDEDLVPKVEPKKDIDTVGYYYPPPIKKLNEKKYILFHHTGKYSTEWNICEHMRKENKAHYCLFKDGTWKQISPHENITYNAGTSEWGEDVWLNDKTIGIEIHSDGHSFTEEQRHGAIALAKEIMKKENIPVENVLAHSDVATPKGRKWDPGPNFYLGYDSFRDWAFDKLK